MTYISYNDYLVHYGVKGMKWGVRHDPELVGRRFSNNHYVYSKNSFSNSNRRPINAKKALKIGAAVAAGMLAAGAGVYLIKSGKVSNLAKLGRKSVNDLSSGGGIKGLKIKSNKTKISDRLSKGKDAFKNTVSKSKPALKNMQAKSSDKASKAFNKMDPYAAKHGIKPLTNNSKSKDFEVINGDLGISDDVKKMCEQFDTNALNTSFNDIPYADKRSYYDAIREGKLMNCTKCTTAALVRDMGYDVSAGKARIGVEPSTVLSWWKGGKFESFGGATLKNSNPAAVAKFEASVTKGSKMSREEQVQKISKALSSYGDGAKGNFNVGGKNGYHSIEFRVEKGVTKIYDNQLGIEYNSVEDFFGKIPHHDPSTSYWMRLDNCKPNIRRMLKDDVIRAR